MSIRHSGTCVIRVKLFALLRREVPWTVELDCTLKFVEKLLQSGHPIWRVKG